MPRRGGLRALLGEAAGVARAFTLVRRRTLRRHDPFDLDGAALAIGRLGPLDPTPAAGPALLVLRADHRHVLAGGGLGPVASRPGLVTLLGSRRAASRQALAAALALAAVTATYYFCLRPAVAGRRGADTVSGCAAAPFDVDRELAQLREEVRVLRAQDTFATGRATRQPRSAGTVDGASEGAR